MRVGIFGGSFDPIHNTHLRIVKEVIGKKLVDEVWVMPCKEHAFGKRSVIFDDRVEMVRLAVDGLERVRVSLFESGIDGVTYTYKTMGLLKEKYPEYEFLWIVGSDIPRVINKWKNYDELLREIEFVVFEREDYPIENKFGMRIKGAIRDNVDGASSTEIRQCVQNGDSLIGLVPGAVEKYIKRKGLYKL